MSSLCFIGDSSVAAIKSGYESIKHEIPGLKCCFFGAFSKQLATLDVRGRTLTTEDAAVRRLMSLTSGGLEEIAVDEYDAFAICGLGFGTSRLIQIYETHRTETMSLSGDRHLVSEGCFRAAARDHLASSLAVLIGDKIRCVAETPIYILPVPRARAGVPHA